MGPLDSKREQSDGQLESREDEAGNKHCRSGGKGTINTAASSCTGDESDNDGTGGGGGRGVEMMRLSGKKKKWDEDAGGIRI